MGNLLLRPTPALIGLALIIYHTAFAASRSKPVVTFTSPCTCEGNHGVSRWAAKTDLAEPPPGNANVKPITPSQRHDQQLQGQGVAAPQRPGSEWRRHGADAQRCGSCGRLLRRRQR